MQIQFISSKPIKNYGTTQLRCLQPADYLRSVGCEVSVGNIREIQPIHNGVIFFHRTASNRFTNAYRNLAKSQGNVLIYDSDDLTFGSAKRGHFLESCDAVSVSTNYLKKYCSGLHSDITVVRNALTDQYLSLAEKIYDYRVGMQPRFVTIGYLSGSPTHDEDFLEVQDVLLKLLEFNPGLSLVIAGKLNFSERFYLFKDRFKYYSFLPYYDYVNLYRGININIAPLNISSEFANGRSELKFMEAGACGIPTVASPTDTYANIINHGNNGLLANNEEEWEATLRSLITDAPLRQKLGENARRQILDHYTEAVETKDYICLIKSAAQKYARSSRPLSSVYYFCLARAMSLISKPSSPLIHN